MPVLGICYGLQEIAWTLGGEVAPCDHREYGHADIELEHDAVGNALFAGFGNHMKVWMSHGDQLSKLPPGFQTVAKTRTSPFAAVANPERRIYGTPRAASQQGRFLGILRNS